MLIDHIEIKELTDEEYQKLYQWYSANIPQLVHQHEIVRLSSEKAESLIQELHHMMDEDGDK